MQAEECDPAFASGAETARTTLRDVPWRWSDVWIGLATLAAMLAYTALTGPEALRRTWIPLTLIVLAWMLVYPLLVARRRIGFPTWPRPRAFLIEGIMAIAIVAVIVTTLTAITQLLTRSLGGVVPTEAPLEPLGFSADRSRLVVLAVLAVVVGPISEEVFFRGMIYNALRRRTNPVVAAILQAAAFGLLHPFHVFYRLIIAVVGLVLAMIYEWRKTLLTPILVHALTNAVSVAMIFVSVAAYDRAPVLGISGEEQEGGCRLTEVMPGGAAGEAGLRVGDVITGAGEYSVADLRDVRLIMLSHKPGDRIPIYYRRGETDFMVEATLKARPR